MIPLLLIIKKICIVHSRLQNSWFFAYVQYQSVTVTVINLVVFMSQMDNNVKVDFFFRNWSCWHYIPLRMVHFWTYQRFQNNSTKSLQQTVFIVLHVVNATCDLQKNIALPFLMFTLSRVVIFCIRHNDVNHYDFHDKRKVSLYVHVSKNNSPRYSM